ncbi:hypothetical protein Tco_1032662 [Tanacetum coccineum]|uniref:Uncharacterized protein n=1 Tax=Tanacetum coccineum TaxID=301880 RepID=A0ABQ5GDW6_9ASTR
MERISKKRTKNEAKNDKTGHGMEKRGKDTVKSKPKCRKVNPSQPRSQKSRKTSLGTKLVKPLILFKEEKEEKKEKGPFCQFGKVKPQGAKLPKDKSYNTQGLVIELSIAHLPLFRAKGLVYGWWSWGYEGGGGSEVVVTVGWWWWRVAESEYGDRVDPVVRTTFGVRRKIPPEKFSGGGVVMAGGGWWLPDIMGEKGKGLGQNACFQSRKTKKLSELSLYNTIAFRDGVVNTDLMIVLIKSRQTLKVQRLEIANQNSKTFSDVEASGSKPRNNTKKNRILPAKTENKKKVENHPRTNKSVWTKVNRVDSSISYKRVVINSNSKSVCKTCNKCLNSANHEMCVVNILISVNATPTVKIVLNKGSRSGNQKANCLITI